MFLEGPLPLLLILNQGDESARHDGLTTFGEKGHYCVFPRITETMFTGRCQLTSGSPCGMGGYHEYPRGERLPNKADYLHNEKDEVLESDTHPIRTDEKDKKGREPQRGPSSKGKNRARRETLGRQLRRPGDSTHAHIVTFARVGDAAGAGAGSAESNGGPTIKTFHILSSKENGNETRTR